jgi:hypothetical protein
VFGEDLENSSKYSIEKVTFAELSVGQGIADVDVVLFCKV